MQFEGHSTTVADIVVDTVGKYAYAIGSPHALELLLIMDVSLEERTKVPAPSMWSCALMCPLLTRRARARNSVRSASKQTV